MAAYCLDPRFKKEEKVKLINTFEREYAHAGGRHICGVPRYLHHSSDEAYYEVVETTIVSRLSKEATVFVSLHMIYCIRS